MMPTKFLTVIFLVTFQSVSIANSREVYYNYGWSSMLSREDTVTTAEFTKVLKDPFERERLSLTVDQVYSGREHESTFCVYSDKLYDPIANKCAKPEDQGHCGDNMIFLPVPNTTELGSCACGNSACWGRPQVLFDNNQCYGIATQGPCGDKETIVPIGKFGIECGPDACLYSSPQCAINFSKGSQLQPYKFPIFDFTYKGKCFRTESQAFCERGQVVRFVLPYKIPVCMDSNEDACVTFESLPSPQSGQTVHPRNCNAGNIIHDGICRPNGDPGVEELRRHKSL